MCRGSGPGAYTFHVAWAECADGDGHAGLLVGMHHVRHQLQQQGRALDGSPRSLCAERPRTEDEHALLAWMPE